MARYTPGHKAESRVRIVDAVGRGFRRSGFGGVGVDGLAKEAGVTHGAFYGHFRSKTDAFQAAIIAGLGELRTGIEMLRKQAGSSWLSTFADFYMGHKRTCDPAQSCTLPSLSPDIERADPEVRTVYEAELVNVMRALADGLVGPSVMDREARAWALLSLFSGGLTLARAVPDPAISEQIADSVRAAALTIAHGQGPFQGNLPGQSANAN